MTELVAGIDVATQAVRVVLADRGGRVHAQADVPLPPPQHPEPGWSEQDARSWWPAAAEALRRATARVDRDVHRLVAVAPTATSGTIVLVDAEGEPLGPALLYNDRRAATEAARAQAAGRARWDALGLTIAPSFALAKLGWLAGERALDGATGAWSAADLIVERLTGAPPTADWSHALKTGYDAVRREWPREVLDALGVSPDLLPPVAPPGSLGGEVSAAAARETGLPEGCQVRLGMTDGCTAQLACGAVAAGRFVSVLGTTLVIKGASEQLVRDPAGVVYSHLHPGGLWLPGGASNTGGEALQAGFAGADLRALDAAAAAHGPARCVAYPLVRNGERFPFLEPRARGFVVGEPADEVEAYRAALEGVAFVERLAYEHLARLGVEAVDGIATAGGGAGSVVWNRIRATVLGRPLFRPRHPSSAFGAALLAAAGTVHDGIDAAVAAMVGRADEFEPDPREAEALDASYLRFVDELRTRGHLMPGR